MKTTKITIARLFNLGSYEHVRYEITVEVGEGESARVALTGLEKIMEALKPERNLCVKTRDELSREARRIAGLKEDLQNMGEEMFRQRHGHFVGHPVEYVARIEAQHTEETAKRLAYAIRARKARQLLDDLGGTEQWRDAKLDWQDDDEY